VMTAEEVTGVLTRHKPFERSVVLANAHEYLTLMGHTMVAWTWLRSAAAATRGLERLGMPDDEAMVDDERRFYLGKLHTCIFFFRHELPKTHAIATLLLAKDTTIPEMEPGWF